MYPLCVTSMSFLSFLYVGKCEEYGWLEGTRSAPREFVMAF